VLLLLLPWLYQGPCLLTGDWSGPDAELCDGWKRTMTALYWVDLLFSCLVQGLGLLLFVRKVSDRNARIGGTCFMLLELVLLAVFLWSVVMYGNSQAAKNQASLVVSILSLCMWHVLCVGWGIYLFFRLKCCIPIKHGEIYPHELIDTLIGESNSSQ
jgi:hypothetical protein